MRQSLRNQDETSLVAALTALRNQFTIKYEANISANDERLLLAKDWLESEPGAQDLFEIWGKTSTRQLSVLTLVLSTLSSTLTLLSSHNTYHSLAAQIVKTILSPSWSSKLNTYLSTSHNELLLVVLKLYNALSAFSGGQEKRAILDTFPWDIKSLPKLLHMRRRNKADEAINILARPDIRTLYVLFLLSFVDATASTAVKASFLEQRRDSLVSIFKGLPQDPYPLVRRVLESCWIGIWSDPKIKKTTKIGLFNEHTIGQILRLYDRNQPEGTNEEEIPADVAHHFLLAVCSHPGSGICFRDRGWYPREDVDNNTQGEVQEPSAHKPGSRIYNKILGNVIKGLKVNEDSRQQELALRILTACPELVAGYWPAAALTLEPRLSSRWISNVAFFGQVISLPVPRSTFLIPASDLYHPSPPPLSTILENILPSVSIKIHLSRGLQSTSTLVQHCAALALAKCLMKYGDVVKALRAAEEALEEDEEEGQWVRRRKEVEREVARRVPEFQVIVGFAQQKANEMRLVSDAEANHTHVNATKAALLSECALRLMWLYHRWLPASVAEARFDVGKLLQGIQDGISPAGTMQAFNASSGLVTLRQLHILRLLKESDQFSWTGKTGSSRGHLSVLLKLYISTELGAARSTISALLRHTLSSTINFQHDADEVDLWLRSLPTIKRASDAEAPDGTPLTSEEEAVISFLDDCAQRCMKTPYRYVEGLQALWSPHKSHPEAEAGDSHPIIDRPDLFPSPMLITILEQMEARFNGNLLPPSDALAIVTYIRKLTLNLAGKVWSLGILHAIANRIKDMTNSIALRPVITAAIHKESTILSTSIQQLEHPSLSLAPAMNPAIEEFLAHVQQVAVPVVVHDRRIAASELVDWIRLAAQPMNSSQFMQLISAVERFHRPSLGQVFQFLLPVEGHLWTAARQMSIADLHLGLDFSLLFFHSDDDTLADEKAKRILVESIFTCDPSVVAVTHALRLIDHRLVSSEQNESRRRDLLLLLAMVMSRLKSSDISDWKAVQQFVFQLECFRECTREPLSGPILQAFQDVIREILDPTDIAQKISLSEFANQWALMLGGDLDSLTDVQVATAVIWLRYMSTEALTVLLDHFCETVQRSRRFAIVFENLLTAINQTLGEMDMATLGTRLPSLLRLQATSPNLLPLEELLAATISDLLPAFYDGQFSQNSYSEKGCAAVVVILEERWACRHIKLESVDIQPFLEREIWSPSAKTIVLSLIYLQSSARVAALQWIRSGAPVAHPAKHIALVTHALLGASSSSPFVDQDSNIIVLILQNLLREITEDTPSSDLTALCVECISLLVIKCPPSVLQTLLSATEEHYKASGFSMQFIALARCFNSSSTLESSDFVRRVVAGGLRWVMEFLSEGQQLAGRVSQTVVELTSLLRLSSEIKPHLVEPVMTAVLQSYLGDGVILRFIDELLLHVNLKPATVNRFLQGIVQHPKFYAICSSNSAGRENLVSLLHRLFHLHPMNTCQPSHAEPLRTVYLGTMSLSDQRLLGIFQLFETTKKVSIGSLLTHWSPSPGTPCSSVLDSLQNLDPGRMVRSCLQYPQWRDSVTEGQSMAVDEQIYDPLFIILLFSQMLIEGPPTSALGWVQLFRTNIVSLLIRALSSHQGSFREMAISQISGLYQHMQDADMQERAHVLYILQLLKDLYPRDAVEGYPIRLSALTTLHLAHALRGVFYPSNFTYPLTARFLMQRPELDASDVPLLYTMLYSAGDQWRKERAWMIRFLSDGMVGRQEWRVLKRRHTWDLVASMFHSEHRDQGLRRSVLEFLAAITCNRHATTSLVLGSALLAWIESQLETVRAGETIAWVKILENIIIVMEYSKLETTTHGEWRLIMSRCLRKILGSQSCTLDVFAQIIPVVLRLSLLPPSATSSLDELISHSMRHIKELEETLQLPSRSLAVQEGVHSSEPPPSHSPHTAYHLWDRIDNDPWNIWGEAVQGLWRAAMSQNQKCRDWDALTCRLLLWRALTSNRSSIAEWARKEVVSCISQSV